MPSYDPDEIPQNDNETSIQFEHDAGLVFTLVLPSKVASSFSKRKPPALLYLRQTTNKEGSGVAIVPTPAGDENVAAGATGADAIGTGSDAGRTQEDQLYWKGPVRVARSIKKAIQSYEGDLSQTKLDEIITATTRIHAASYVNTLFNMRDYAKAEVEDKLLSAGYDKDVVQEIAQKAQDGNLINDERFSEVFIRSKIMDGWGPRKIQQALAKRGIALDEVKGWPEEFIAHDQEVERAYALIKHRSVLRKNPFEKSVRFLASKGFSYDICKQAALRLVDDCREQME